MEAAKPIDPRDQLRSSDSLLFAEKAARSISEIQGGVNNIGDVYVFLEVLGFDDKVASENGFSSLMELSGYVFNFVEFYDEEKYGIVNDFLSSINESEAVASHLSGLDAPQKEEKDATPQSGSGSGAVAIPSPSLKTRISEALSHRVPPLPSSISSVAAIAEKGLEQVEHKARLLPQQYQRLQTLHLQHVHKKAKEAKNTSGNKEEGAEKGTGLLPIPSLKTRISEALSIHSAWLTALFMLNITGFSLWMAQRLPADVTIAFVSGVFIGLIASEGPLQMFSRLLFISYEQKNFSEFKRSLLRAYIMIGVVLAAVVGITVLITQSLNIPDELITIASAAIATVAIHRMSFMVVYALRKFRSLFISYAAAFIVLLAVYFLVPAETIPTDITSRYFVSLWSAFGILTVFAVYHHYSVFKQASLPQVHKGPVPTFYNAPAVIQMTIKSRFSVQFWESIPYFLFGTFYFAMIFSDRVLSWIFNPKILIAANGALMPMVFNSEYHAGADVALLVLLPTAIIQHVIISPIFALLNNKMATLKITEIDVLNKFLKQKHRDLVLASIVATLIPTIVLNIFADDVMVLVHGSETSLEIMRYASAGNVLLAIFSANSLFITFLNRAKIPFIIAIGGLLVIAIAGWILGQQLGDERIIFAYVAGAGGAAIASAVYAMRITKTSAIRLLARYS